MKNKPGKNESIPAEEVNKPALENPMSVADALDCVASYARQGRLSVLCGAGISVPGGLPLTKKLVSAILDWTSLSDIEKGWVMKIVPDRLPFERMMEILLDTMAEGAKQQLIGMFRLGAPGTAHTFLAEACARGLINTICTTNFDCHLEAALNDAGLKQDEQYALYQDLESLRSIDWSANAIRILKLHGSVERPAEMAVTVSKVADQTAAATLSAIMERIFGAGEDHAVLTLGYSFSDRFDLSPTIERIGREGSRSWVLNVDHDDDIFAEKAVVTEYPNVVFDPDSFYLPGPLLINPAAMQLKADTDWVMRELAGRLEIELPQQKSVESKWHTYLEQFKKDLDTKSDGMLPDSLAGSFLMMIGADEAAIPYLQRTIAMGERSGNAQVQLVTAQLLIEGYLGAGHYDEAWKLLNQTEPLARSLEDGKHADYVLSQFGTLYKQLAETCLDRSRRYFEEALGISIREDNEMRAVPQLAGIAAAWMRLGDMDAARLRYEQAYEISSKSADPFREAEVCGNLASLEYIVQHYEKALEWYDEAIRLSHLAGDQRIEGIHRMNKANVFVKQKRYPEAFACYKAARDLVKEDRLLKLLDYHEAAAIRLSGESTTVG